MKNSVSFRGGYAIRDQFETHFLTFAICGWIDLFTRGFLVETDKNF